MHLAQSGNIINAPHLLRNLYLDTYVDRLRHREMQPEFSEVYSMKTTLWEYNYEMLKSKKSHNWEMTNLEMVLKNLKKNKSRDPDGFINDIFKPNVIGNNLKDGLLLLANGIKSSENDNRSYGL